MVNNNNIFDQSFELHLIKIGYNLDTISLKESLDELKLYNKLK